MNVSNYQVIARIFYVVNRSWSGHITVSELRKSNFLSVSDAGQSKRHSRSGVRRSVFVFCGCL